MNLRQRRITIELGRGRRRHYIRTVRNAEKTGHVAVNWVGRSYTQWKGQIKLNNKIVDVWGYASTYDNRPPGLFSNDTY